MEEIVKRKFWRDSEYKEAKYCSKILNKSARKFLIKDCLRSIELIENSESWKRGRGHNGAIDHLKATLFIWIKLIKNCFNLRIR